MKTKRYIALDVLRGMTIAGMILVNTAGSGKYVYAPLRHAKWDGCTPTDLVFPFFLFAVGLSMFFSLSKYGKSLSKEALLKVGKRTLLIFAIGLFLNSFPQWSQDFSTLRIMGVLQRIALAYFGASLLILALNKPKHIAIAGGGLLLFYWAVLLLFGNNPFSLQGNIVGSIDIMIFGEAHMYQKSGIPFDPEGLLSTLPSIVTVIIGYLTGVAIQQTESNKLPRKLFVAGVILIVAGWLWGLLFPINKALWTSSYVLFTAGQAQILLAFLIWVIDIKKKKVPTATLR